MSPEFTIAELYEVADDHQTAVLDELRHKAGHVWTCKRGHRPWTNAAGEPCGECGEPQPKRRTR